MKLRNAPGRKWARQMAALDRLPAGRKGERVSLTHERDVLVEASRLGDRRGVRTKKDRSDRARLVR